MVVLVRGVLRGMGREVQCDVVAIRRIGPGTLPNSDEPQIYTDFDVLDAPDDLPEGEYTIDFGGQMMPARKHRGLWHSVQGSAARF